MKKTLRKFYGNPFPKSSMNRRSDPSFQYKNLFDVLKIILCMSVLQELDSSIKRFLLYFFRVCIYSDLRYLIGASGIIFLRYTLILFMIYVFRGDILNAHTPQNFGAQCKANYRYRKSVSVKGYLKKMVHMCQGIGEVLSGKLVH